MTQIAACDVRRARPAAMMFGRRHDAVAVLVVLVDADAVEARARRRTRAGPCTRCRRALARTGSNSVLGMSTHTERFCLAEVVGQIRPRHQVEPRELHRRMLARSLPSDAVGGAPDQRCQCGREREDALKNGSTPATGRSPRSASSAATRTNHTVISSRCCWVTTSRGRSPNTSSSCSASGRPEVLAAGHLGDRLQRRLVDLQEAPAATAAPPPPKPGSPPMSIGASVGMSRPIWSMLHTGWDGVGGAEADRVHPDVPRRGLLGGDERLDAERVGPVGEHDDRVRLERCRWPRGSNPRRRVAAVGRVGRRRRSRGRRRSGRRSGCARRSRRSRRGWPCRSPCRATCVSPSIAVDQLALVGGRRHDEPGDPGEGHEADAGAVGLALDERARRLLGDDEPVRGHVGRAHRAGHVHRQEDRRRAARHRPRRPVGRAAPTPSTTRLATSRATGTRRFQCDRLGIAARITATLETRTVSLRRRRRTSHSSAEQQRRGEQAEQRQRPGERHQARIPPEPAGHQQPAGDQQQRSRTRRTRR